MRVAITGGNGFVGAALADLLTGLGHEAVRLSRRSGGDVGDEAAMRAGFSGCNAVAHCAGINRQIGEQTFEHVHVQGTRNVVQAARRAGIKHILLVSFLRARPDCGSAYHESKFAAEQIVRESGIPYVIFKPGVIYGRGDNMLNHLKRSFKTFPVFGFVGLRDHDVAPLHVDDMARLLLAGLTDDRLLNRTFAVTGPETLGLRQAVRRVAKVVGSRPLAFPLPIWFHRLFATAAELLMRQPVVSRAQVRILSEGVAESVSDCELLPTDLLPAIPFSEDRIRAGLPEAGHYGLRDLRCGLCS
jgi:uncharacterized protein YbjT (DUF2867 family)